MLVSDSGFWWRQMLSWGRTALAAVATEGASLLVAIPVKFASMFLRDRMQERSTTRFLSALVAAGKAVERVPGAVRDSIEAHRRIEASLRRRCSHNLLDRLWQDYSGASPAEQLRIARSVAKLSGRWIAPIIRRRRRRQPWEPEALGLFIGAGVSILVLAWFLVLPAFSRFVRLGS
jgi:hypothetical protein